MKNSSTCIYLVGHFQGSVKRRKCVNSEKPRKKPGLRAGYGRELEARLGELYFLRRPFIDASSSLLMRRLFVLDCTRDLIRRGPAYLFYLPPVGISCYSRPEH
jgi:hypothetical protein